VMSIEMWLPGVQKFDSAAVHVIVVGWDQS
jgi:hypothetical protein